MIAHLTQQRQDAAWNELDQVLGRFEDAHGFAGPGEVNLVAQTLGRSHYALMVLSKPRVAAALRESDPCTKETLPDVRPKSVAHSKADVTRLRHVRGAGWRDPLRAIGD
jgi:hypothetical protein